MMDQTSTRTEGKVTVHLRRNASKIALFALFARLALSYLDPGTGSLIIQIFLGLLLSTLFFVKVFWKKVKNIFGRSSETSPEEPQEE
jgi:hypothetical protein